MTARDLSILVDRAGTQLGLVTVWQADSLRVKRPSLEYLVSKGGLERVYPGVFRLPGAPPNHEQDCLAAQLYLAGPRNMPVGALAIAEHSAAFLQQFLDEALEQVPVVVPKERLVRTPGILARRRGPLLRTDVRELPSGIVVTAPELTLLHLAEVVDEKTFEQAWDAADRRRLLRRRRMEEIVATYPTVHGAFARFLGLDPSGRPPTESDAELHVARLLADHGYPEPVRQFPVVLGPDSRYRLDFAWPGVRVGLEVDGRLWHSGARREARDNARDLEMALADWLMVRWWVRDVRRDPASCLAQLHRALEARGLAW